MILPVALVAIVVGSIVLGSVFAFRYVAEGVNDPFELAMRMQDDWRFISLVLVYNMMVFAGLAFIAAWFSRERLSQRLGLVRPTISPPTLLLVIVGTGFLWATMMIALRAVIDLPMEELATEVQPFLNIGEVHPMLLLVLIAVLPPIAEELLFRGYVQRRLTRRWGPVVGIAGAGFAFAFFHGHLLHKAVIFPLGLWCGFVAWRSASVLPAMLAYAANNTLAAIFILCIPMLMVIQEYPELSLARGMATPLIVLFMLTTGVCFVWAVVRLLRTDGSGG